MPPQPSEEGSSCCKLYCSRAALQETTLPHETGAYFYLSITRGLANRDWIFISV